MIRKIPINQHLKTGDQKKQTKNKPSRFDTCMAQMIYIVEK